MTSAIFISYRRQESLVEARALFERLRGELGPGRVFIDLEGLDYGVDFVEVLEQQLAHCKVMLALIGPDWLATHPSDGTRRIDDENDFVRIELRTALERKIRVVPVLLDGAAMPRANALPEDVRSLVRRQALHLDFRRFDAEVEQLIGTLRRVLDAPQAGQAVAPEEKVPVASPQPRTIDHETSARPDPGRDTAAQETGTLPVSHAASASARPSVVRQETTRRAGYRASDIEPSGVRIDLGLPGLLWHRHKAAVTAVVVIAAVIGAVAMLNSGRSPTTASGAVPASAGDPMPLPTQSPSSGVVPPAGLGMRNAAAEPAATTKAAADGPFDATVAPAENPTLTNPSRAAADAAMNAAASAMDAASSARK